MRLRAGLCGLLIPVILGLGACVAIPKKVRVEIDDRSIEYRDTPKPGPARAKDR